MKSRIETAVGNADESAFQKHILYFFLFCLVQLAGDYTYADFPSDKAKIICSYIDCYSTSNLVEVI